jgi:hypothetical protein
MPRHHHRNRDRQCSEKRSRSEHRHSEHGDSYAFATKTNPSIIELSVDPLPPTVIQLDGLVRSKGGWTIDVTAGTLKVGQSGTYSINFGTTLLDNTGLVPTSILLSVNGVPQANTVFTTRVQAGEYNLPSAEAVLRLQRNDILSLLGVASAAGVEVTNSGIAVSSTSPSLNNNSAFLVAKKL